MLSKFVERGIIKGIKGGKQEMEKEKKKLNFKIIILVAIGLILISALIIFLLANKSITLTQDNYSSYLQISPIVTPSGQFTVRLDTNYNTGMMYNSTENQYSKVQMSVNSKGLSDNFIYEDVEIEVHFQGDIPLQKKEDVSYSTNI